MMNNHFIIEIARDNVYLNGADDIDAVPDKDKHIIGYDRVLVDNIDALTAKLAGMKLVYPHVKYLFDSDTKDPAGVWFGNYNADADRLDEVWVAVMKCSDGDAPPIIYTDFDFLFA